MRRRKPGGRSLLLLAALFGLLVFSVRPAAAGGLAQGEDCQTVFVPAPPPGHFTTVCSGGVVSFSNTAESGSPSTSAPSASPMRFQIDMVPA